MKTPDFKALFSTVWVTPFVGPAIVMLRTRQHLTQKQLAKAAGLDLSALKRLEAGRKRGGWITTAEQVCRALDVTLQQLFELAQKLAQQDALQRLWAGHDKEASCLLA